MEEVPANIFEVPLEESNGLTRKFPIPDGFLYRIVSIWNQLHPAMEDRETIHTISEEQVFEVLDKVLDTDKDWGKK